MLNITSGDILAVRGRGFFSRGILRITGGPVTHVGIVLATDPEPLAIEALWRVKTRPLAKSIEDAEAAWILSPLNLTKTHRAIIVAVACDYSADDYGWWDIGLQLLDAAFRTTWFTDHALWAIRRFPIYSFLVAEVYGKEGLTFGNKQEQSTTPADIYHFAVQNPDKYAITRIK